MAEVKNYRYTAGLAPFGELDIILPHYSRNDTVRSSYINRPEVIAREAWLHSLWFHDEVDAAGLTDPEKAIDPAMSHVRDDALDGFYLPGHTLALAIQPVGADAPRDEHGVIRGNPVGYVTGRQEVSGNFVMRGLKRLFIPRHVFQATNNENVLPSHQDKKLGAALLHARLQDIPDPAKNPTTVFIVGNNTSLRAKLLDVGYRPTWVRTRRDLIRGTLLREERLEAESAAFVIEGLRTWYPWLNEVEPTTGPEA